MVEKIWSSPEIYRIPVPLPDNPLRDLNSYVIRTPERALIIDTGFNRPECREALLGGLKELRLDWSGAALFLTHLHSDHTGLVWDFVMRNVPVYMGRAEYQYLTVLNSGEARTVDDIFLREGFPPEQLELQNQSNQGVRYASKAGFPVEEVEDGDAIPMGGLELRAIWTPGHTPGHMALYLPGEQLLFTGDHILFDITPNISIWPGIPNALSDFIASLRKIRALPLRGGFPAHRSAGTDIKARIDQLIDHHGWRLDEIYQATVHRPGSTAYEIAGHITWSVRGRSWEQFPPHQKWFAMGETLAHLDYLAGRGQLLRSCTDGIARYYPARGDQKAASGA